MDEIMKILPRYRDETSSGFSSIAFPEDVIWKKMFQSHSVGG